MCAVNRYMSTLLQRANCICTSNTNYILYVYNINFVCTRYVYPLCLCGNGKPIS